MKDWLFCGDFIVGGIFRGALLQDRDAVTKALQHAGAPRGELLGENASVKTDEAWTDQARLVEQVEASGSRAARRAARQPSMKRAQAGGRLGAGVLRACQQELLVDHFLQACRIRMETKLFACRLRRRPVVDRSIGCRVVDRRRAASSTGMAIS